MVNQTEFIDHLKKHMYESNEKEYYLESIMCSFAIVENRTKRLLEHLGLPVQSQLYLNIEKLQQVMRNKTSNNKAKSKLDDEQYKKLAKFITYHLQVTKLLDEVTDVNELNNLEIEDDEHLLTNFRKKRNNLVHESLFLYDSTHPKLTDFGEYKRISTLGIETAVEISKVASKTKKRKKRLQK